MSLGLDLPREVKQGLERVLANLLSIANLSYRSNVLKNAVASYVNNPGKLVRPTLTLLTAYLLNGNLEAAINAATAVECVHIAALLQDDVFDDHKVRRGIPTPACVYGEHFSILASNVFIAKAVEFCARTGIPEILNEIASAAIRLTDGESRELELRRENRRVTLKEYFEIILGKTASLIEVSLTVGAYTSRRGRQVVEKLRILGRLLGLAYQIRDDIVDFLNADPKNPSALENVNIVNVLEQEHGRDLAIRKAARLLSNILKVVERLVWDIFGSAGFIFASLIERNLQTPMIRLF